MAGPDPLDPASRTPPVTGAAPVRTVGVPDDSVLAPCDDRTRRLFAVAVERLAELGVAVRTVDLSAYLAAGELLYGDAFVAERTAAVGAFLEEAPDADPTVAAIVAAGRGYTAVDLVAATERLAALRLSAGAVFDEVDAVVLPTAPFHPSVDEVDADPIGTNARIGTFVAGCNLVDWCAAAVPVETDDGLPFGVQLLGPAWSDRDLWSLAARFVGEPDQVVDDRIRLVVAGAHLRGQPLNHQLTDRGATLAATTHTAPVYRMVALEGPTPKPGLVRVGAGGGSVEVEVWALDAAAFGAFVAAVPAPLCIGTVELADGTSAPGFLCEPHAAEGAPDITATGGWRAWLGHDDHDDGSTGTDRGVVRTGFPT